MVENMYRKVNEHIQPNLHCIDGNMTTPKISEGQNNNIENNVTQNNEDVLHFDHSDIHSEKNPSLKCMYTNTDSLSNKLEELELFLHTHNVEIYF